MSISSKRQDAPTCGVEALDELFNLPCLDVLLCFVAHFDRVHERKARRCLLYAQGKGREGARAAAFVLCCHPPQHFSGMTRKRKRDSGPPEIALDAAGTAQLAHTNESGQALEEETRSDMDLGVTDAQNNTVSATKKRPKTKKKTTQGRGPLAPKPKIIKLKPARPYPTVPTSSSATVPKSRRAEGRNKVCVTRRTELGSYLRQCRDVLTKDGYVHVRQLDLACTLIVRTVTRNSTCLQWVQPSRTRPCSQLPWFESSRILKTK